MVLRINTPFRVWGTLDGLKAAKLPAVGAFFLERHFLDCSNRFDVKMISKDLPRHEVSPFLGFWRGWRPYLWIFRPALNRGGLARPAKSSFPYSFLKTQLGFLRPVADQSALLKTQLGFLRLQLVANVALRRLQSRFSSVAFRAITRLSLAIAQLGGLAIAQLGLARGSVGFHSPQITGFH